MTTATQKIPTGYKQTDIGVIPVDWDVKRLGDIVQFNNGKAHEQFINDKGNYVVVNSKFISTKGEVFKTSDKNLSPLFEGEIVMVMSDIPHGRALAKCFFIRENGKYTLNQRICSFKSLNSDSLYLFYKLNRNKYFLDFDSGVGQTNLRRIEVLDCPVAVPSNKKEQSAIAAALSESDALIEKLEELIEKKKNIKWGVMQGLLTGKRRLPGFSGNWESKRLGDVSEMSSGGTPSSGNPLYYGGKIPWVVIADMTRITKYLFETEKKITSQGLENSSAKIFPNGTLLFAMYASIGKCAIAKVDVTCNQAILGINTKNIDTEFLYYYLSFNEQTFLQMGQSGTQNNLNKEIVENLKIPYPQIPEQTAIATILSDMDIEIEKLESQLTKYQNLKQGMMQMLLTGKIRLHSK
jgi:type I restriction enzyme S subunit